VAREPLQWLVTAAAISMEPDSPISPIKALPYLGAVGFVGFRGYKAYQGFQAAQDSAVKDYAVKAMKATSAAKSLEVHKAYTKKTYGRRQYEMVLALMVKFLYDPVTVDNVERFARLWASTGADGAALVRVVGDLRKDGEKSKLLFYARRLPEGAVAEASVSELYGIVDAGQEAGFVDSLQQSLLESAYEQKLRLNYIGYFRDNTNENVTITVTYQPDEDAADVLCLDDATAAKVLGTLNAKPGSKDILKDDEDNKGMMQQRAERAAGGNANSNKEGSFSTQFREPPKSERLIEMACSQCNHLVMVTPKEAPKFFAGFTECPKCANKVFKKVSREDLWFEYLGRDPKKVKEKASFEAELAKMTGAAKDE